MKSNLLKMNDRGSLRRFDWILLTAIIFLLLISLLVLRSIAGGIFPLYFVYLTLAFLIFIFITQIDIEIFQIFSKHLYILSVVVLILPLLIGQVTRGAIRWIPIGSLTLQPSEIVRPFLFIFFADYLTKGILDLKRIIKVIGFIVLPLILIFMQPALGVAILTFFGFLGVFLASSIKKKNFLLAAGLAVLLIPILWLLLKPYQRQRIYTFMDPELDPQGAGYNSIQSMISVGSGGITGRGLGEGAQTQLAFLPEAHTDFIFAAIAEELGFLGAILVLLALFIVFWRLVVILENASSPAARAYVAGVFLLLLSETLIHVGMNMGLVPITGVPLPFVSAGGSALLGSSIAIAIAMKARKST